MGDTTEQMRHVPKLVWIPWALFSVLELISGQFALSAVFAGAGLGISAVLWMRLNRSELRVGDGTFEWRNWPTGWRMAQISDIAGVRSAKGVNRIHSELLIVSPRGRVKKRAVWARPGSQAAEIAEQLGLSGANRA